jgi:23S rRNA (uridine2552-2'-O)-methyltransferase
MRKVRDHYAQKARHEQYHARSIYKLREIDQKFHLVGRARHVLDIGCAPGSWSQYILERAGNVYLTGVDLAPSVEIKDKGFRYIQADILQHDFASSLVQYMRREGKTVFFDLILSDAAPKTTGDKFSDSQFSLRLVEAVFLLSASLLKEGGSVVAKIFQGEDLKDFVDSLKKQYARVDLFKPRSSRAESRELYIIAQNKGERL